MRLFSIDRVQIAMVKAQTPLRSVFLFVMIFSVSGCSTAGYYLDLMAGQSDLIERRQPIQEMLENRHTSPKLYDLLTESVKMRDFASNVLHLPENDSYRLYADLKRPYAVWNVVAAKEFSMKPRQWCFLFVGCLSYRGYFSKQAATDFANKLKKEGYDVYVAGARAYSPLGWFDDPLLNTMMYKSEAYRAGIIFHELAHQEIYVDDDSAFNEAFATAVEEEGIQRWFSSNGKQKEYKKYLVEQKRDNQFNELLRKTREQLKQLYSEKISLIEMRKAKQTILKKMLVEYEVLKTTWHGYSGYDDWMHKGVNNAKLVLVATYHDLVPGFKRVLAQYGNDLRTFYQAVKRISKLEKQQRDKQLTPG